MHRVTFDLVDQQRFMLSIESKRQNMPGKESLPIRCSDIERANLILCVMLESYKCLQKVVEMIT